MLRQPPSEETLIRITGCITRLALFNGKAWGWPSPGRRSKLAKRLALGHCEVLSSWTPTVNRPANVSSGVTSSFLTPDTKAVQFQEEAAVYLASDFTLIYLAGAKG
jgi:hypothetical protein